MICHLPEVPINIWIFIKNLFKSTNIYIQTYKQKNPGTLTVREDVFSGSLAEDEPVSVCVRNGERRRDDAPDSHRFEV